MNKVRNALLLLLVLCAALPTLAAELPSVPLFRYGIIADTVGAANLVLTDINGDGKAEIVTCSNGTPFALEYRSGDYVQLWYGANVGCNGVTTGDVDGDGATDVIVAGGTKLYVFDPRGLGNARATATTATTGYDVTFGNVDFDAGAEIIVAGTSATYVYDAATLALEWTASGYGGTAVFAADVDGDARNEIVLSDGSVLDAGNKVFKWGYLGGFPQVAVGNLDGDAKAEIAFTTTWGNTVTVLNGDTMTTSTVTGFGTIQQVAIGDANGDGVNEVITGNDQWGSMSGRRPTDSTLVWQIGNPEHGCMGVAVGDVDGDGVREVVWGAGWTSSGEDALFVGSALTQTVEWESQDLDGPFSIAAADVDSDGTLEIAVVSGGSRSGYAGGVVKIFDALTGSEELEIMVGYSTVTRIAFAQFDDDAALEIAIGMSGVMRVYDAVTGALQWTSPGYMVGMAIANLDGDATAEIVSITDGKIVVMHGVSNIIQSSRVFDGNVLTAGDVTGDGIAEVIAKTSSTLYVLSSTLATQAEIPMNYVFAAATTPAAGGRIAVLGGSDRRLYLFDKTLVEQWSCDGVAGYDEYTAVAFGTIGGELRVLAGDDAGVVRSMQVDGSSCPAFDSRDIGGRIQGISTFDVTGDGRDELLIGSQNAAEIALAGLSGETLGDVTGDNVVASNDIDQLVDYLFGTGPGLSTAGDANADERLSGEDAFALIHHEYGGGALPPG